MSKFRLVILAVVFCIFLSPISTFAEEITPTNVIYLIDVSTSMKRGGLFENIKSRINELVQKERKVGDKISLITFGEDVRKIFDIEIKSQEDIYRIKKIVHNLSSNDRCTWVSKACAETIQTAESIKSKSSGGKLLIYILSDSKNNPPYWALEPQVSFVDVVCKYFGKFDKKDSYVYLISYGVLTPDEERKLRQSNIISAEPAKPVFPRILLFVSGFHFGNVNVSEKEAVRSGEITIGELQDVETGEKVQLIPEEGEEVQPDSILCKQKGQKENISIVIPKGLKPGDYSRVIKLRCEKAPVEPSEFQYTFSVPSGEVSKPAVIPPPKIKKPYISFNTFGFNFGNVDVSEKEVIRSGYITIQEFRDIEFGAEVQLIPQEGEKIQPTTIKCDKKGQREKITITIPQGFKGGDYNKTIKLHCYKASIEPSQFQYSFSVVNAVLNKLLRGLFKIIFLALIVFLFYIFWIGFLSRKTIWAERIGEGASQEIMLNGWNVVYLGKKGAASNIAFGLPKYYLQRRGLKGLVFLTQEGGESKKIKFGENNKCRDIDENEIVIKFYEERPKKAISREETEKPSKKARYSLGDEEDI